MSDRPTPLDPWAALRETTPARIGLGRRGAGLPTAPMLAFQAAHAAARDAVAAPFDVSAVLAGLADLRTIVVQSQAPDPRTYLSRPDLGRRLAIADAARLAALGADLAIVIGDGLSAVAAARHGPPLARALVAALPDWTIAPVVIARGARVALGDEIGELLGARAVAMLIGERPGLSAADSLGAYVTWGPRVGRLDSERNCVSNIRPEGLPIAAAAGRIAWLLDAARCLGATGVALKDASGAAPLLPP